MFCRQCGCELGENDRFCFNCGTPVQKVDPSAYRRAHTEPQEEAPAEQEAAVAAPAEEAAPEPAAVPEVETAPEPELKAAEEPAAAAEPEEAAAPEIEPEPAFETFVEIGSQPVDDIEAAGTEHEAFDWNVYAFPSDVPRKTEDVKFDWGIAEGEYKRRPREDDREIAFAPEPPKAPQAPAAEEMPEITKEELFGGSVVSGITGEGEGLSKQASKIDKFYKEDKRIEEFQKLLDSEYEKFRAGRPLDQDSFAETVESIKERTAPGSGRQAGPMFGGAAEDMDKTAVFHRISGLEKAPEEIPAKTEPEHTTLEDIEKLLSNREEAQARIKKPEPKKESKGGLFGFAARRADKNRTLEMEKEDIQNALDSVFTTKSPEETINDIFGNKEEDEAKETLQEELDRQIDDKTTEFDPAVLREKIAEAEAAEKAAQAAGAAEAEPAAEEPAAEEPAEEIPAEEAAEAEPTAEEPATEAPAEEAVEEAEKTAEGQEEAEPAAEEPVAEAPAEEVQAEEAAEAEPAAEEPAEKVQAETPAEEAPAEGAAEEAEKKAEDAKDKPAEAEKSGKGGTIAIVILSLILVALLVLIGLKFFMPGFMADNGSAVPTAAAMDRTEYDGDLNGIIQTQLDRNYGEEIRTIKYDSSWKAEGVDGTKKIKNNVWYKAEDGTVHYIDESVVGTVIAYESRMQAMDQNGDLKVLDLIKEGTDLHAETEAVLSSSEYEPMKSLTFGKIRKTEDGSICVWVREEKADITEKVITLEADGHRMLVTAEQEI